MPSTRPTVLLAMAPHIVSRLFDDQLIQRLQATAVVDPSLVVDDFSSPAAGPSLARADVLLTCWGCPPIDAAVLERAPALRAIVHGAGSVKKLVTPACWHRGIRVSSAASANAVPVAEYTVAMIVLANKHVLDVAAAYRADGARRDWASEYAGYGNYGKTVGVVGASRVGRKVLELLRPYDLDVLLADPTIADADAERLGARLVDLDTLVRASDVVSIHAPDISATRGLFDARRLRLLRDGATLINTARGRIVDTDALTTELATGRIYAVLDVTDPEPLPAGHPLFAMPNVLLTPHIAGSHGSEVRRLGALAISELERYTSGDEFAYPVHEEQLEVVA